MAAVRPRRPGLTRPGFPVLLESRKRQSRRAKGRCRMARERKPQRQPVTMPPTAGDVLLGSMRRHGVENLFVNPGTDFPPIVEGLARARESGMQVPRAVLVPHENLAVAMA